jgi:hypothetical protein
MSTLWWQPSEIRFTRQQLKQFILPNLEELREGHYPSAPAGRSTKHSQSKLAPFVIAADIAAEVDSRLKLIPNHTFIDEYFMRDIDEREICIRHQISMYSFHRELNKMVSYLSGWKRKRIDYPSWCLLNRIRNTR